MWLMLFALIFSPNFREPLTAKENYWDYSISGDPVLLHRFMVKLADTHCHEWRLPVHVGVEQWVLDWREAVIDSRISGTVDVRRQFFLRYIFPLHEFRRQFPKRHCRRWAKSWHLR